jgi:ATP-dependent Clp protease ATP-binding subunit ClpA
LRPSGVASRFAALRGSALTPLVGRDEEIDLLLRRWTRAKAGNGQVVLISGKPGLGKSRITAALEERRRPAASPPALFQLALPPGQRALSLCRPT